MWTNIEQTAYAYTGGKPFNPSLPCVVMIHGAQNDHSVWALQSRWLAHHGYAVLAFDLPAHGRSNGPALPSIEEMAAWVLMQLDQLNVDRFHLVGHSMGSLIALEISHLAANRVCSIALLGTAAPMPVSQTLLDLAQAHPIQAFHQINAWSHRASINAYRTVNPGSNPIGIGFNLMQRIGLQHGKDVLPNDFQACNNYQNGTNAIQNAQAPVLVMNGLNDSMTTAKAAKTLSALGRNVRLHLIDNCGHALMSEQPDVVLDEIAAHLKHSLAQ